MQFHIDSYTSVGAHHQPLTEHFMRGRLPDDARLRMALLGHPMARRAGRMCMGANKELEWTILSARAVREVAAETGSPLLAAISTCLDAVEGHLAISVKGGPHGH